MKVGSRAGSVSGCALFPSPNKSSSAISPREAPNRPPDAAPKVAPTVSCAINNTMNASIWDKHGNSESEEAPHKKNRISGSIVYAHVRGTCRCNLDLFGCGLRLCHRAKTTAPTINAGRHVVNSSNVPNQPSVEPPKARRLPECIVDMQGRDADRSRHTVPFP